MVFSRDMIVFVKFFPPKRNTNFIYSDKAFEPYKFFQIGLASILLVTLPIMIGRLKFTELQIFFFNNQPHKVRALIYAWRKSNRRTKEEALKRQQKLFPILHLHLLKPMHQDETLCYSKFFFNFCQNVSIWLWLSLLSPIW